MTIADRVRQIVRVLPMALVLWLGSRVFFDFVTRQPMFWSSKETLAALALNGALFVPLMVFVLVLVMHKYNPETKV